MLIDGKVLAPAANSKSTDDSKGTPMPRPDLRVPGLEGGSPQPA